MMVHFLDGQRGRGHESESVDEVREFVFLVQLGIGDSPPGETVEGIFELGAGEFPHKTIIHPDFR
jgi:hypothetical protein